MFTWLKENKTWVFSGIGVTTCVTLLSLFLNNRNQAHQQQNQSGTGNIQARGDVTVIHPSSQEVDLSEGTHGQDLKVKFVCGIHNNAPATIMKFNSSGHGIPLIAWVKKYDSSFGKTPQQRCILASGKFQAFYEAELLGGLKHGKVNQQNVICIVSNKEDNCTFDNILFPLDPETNPEKALQTFRILNSRESPREVLLN